MINSKDIFFLGYFGNDSNQLDGQTIKTREIHKLFENKTNCKIRFFDTERLKKSWFKILILLAQLTKVKLLVYLPAQNNLKLFFPLLFILSKLFRFKIHYFVIGGWLPQFVIEHKSIGKKLKNISCVYVETRDMLSKLTDVHGFINVIWFPNFRIYDFEPRIKKSIKKPLRLVFMSRIIKSKGYDIVFHLAERIRKEIGDETIIIHFYGPTYENEKNAFFDGIKKYAFVKYCGVLQPEEIHRTLSLYDAMLFPTCYPGEGLPGTILDSYISGIPVIASDWRYNGELVDHGVSGFIFKLSDENEFFEYVKLLLTDRDLLFDMKQNAFAKSKEFDMENAWNIIKEHTGIAL